MTVDAGVAKGFSVMGTGVFSSPLAGRPADGV